MVIAPIDENPILIFGVIYLDFERTVVDYQRIIRAAGFFAVDDKLVTVHRNTIDRLTGFLDFDCEALIAELADKRHGPSYRRQVRLAGEPERRKDARCWRHLEGWAAPFASSPKVSSCSLCNAAIAAE